MRKKNEFIVLMYLIIMVMFLSACTLTKDAKLEDNNDSLHALIINKIENYTKETFRFTEEIKFEKQKDQMSLFVSLVPEIGSVPIKEDIYRSVASHAFDVIKFFPEVTSFNYSILWDDREKTEVMQIILDEEAVKSFNNHYYEQVMNIKNGLDSSYQSIFSSITVTGAAEKWSNAAVN
ncbi:hypothetical protein EBB07_34595 [Paenibacillaceae bacterium]|nr:hypothetical protein EBB07_34595 [Paenibacillaceae bacterium]